MYYVISGPYLYLYLYLSISISAYLSTYPPTYLPTYLNNMHYVISCIPQVASVNFGFTGFFTLELAVNLFAHWLRRFASRPVCVCVCGGGGARARACACACACACARACVCVSVCACVCVLHYTRHT